MDREIIHILPQEYVIDDNDGVREPIGMSGVRLEAKVHIVTAQSTSLQNIMRCCQRAELQVNTVVLEQLASAEAVLLDEERELGVVMVDIGGGTTDIAIFYNNAVVHTAVVPIGGNHVSGDIAIGLRTPRAEAERIKIQSGCAALSLIDEEERINVTGVAGRGDQRSRHMLCEIIEPRVEEIFMLVAQEIERSGFADLIGSGIVLTGGSSMMQGMEELATEVFQVPVRVGRPEQVGGLVDVVKSQKYATGVGLVAWGIKNPAVIQKSRGSSRSHNGYSGGGHSNNGRGMWGRVRDWFKKVV